MLHAAIYFDREGGVVGAALFDAPERRHGDDRLKRVVLAHGPVCDVRTICVFRAKDRCIAEYTINGAPPHVAGDLRLLRQD